MTSSKAFIARGVVTSMALTLIMIAPTRAVAETPTRPAVTIAASGFNWLAKNENPTEAQAAEQLRERQIAAAFRMGDGSWVCSPAGFGQPSRCSRN